MMVINEESTAWLELSFTDKEGDPVTPDSVSYRIDSGDKEVKSNTNITPGETVEITMTPEDNKILGSGNYQLNTVTVTAILPSEEGEDAQQQTSEFNYKIKNLRYIS